MPRAWRAVILVGLVVCAAVVSAGADAKKSTLVLLDNVAQRQLHSRFFAALEDVGHVLHFRAADDSELVLKQHGDFLYDNLIIFAQSASEFGGSIDVPAILEFVDSGRNAIIAASSEISDTIRELGLECGVDFDEQRTQAIDHFSYDASDEDGDHVVIAADMVIPDPDSVIFGGRPLPGPVLYEGLAHTPTNRENRRLLPMLWGSPTAYSHNPDESMQALPRAVGKDCTYVSVLQARNNARVIISGSVDMFTDRRFAMPVRQHTPSGVAAAVPSGNEVFCTELAKWAFKERGVLRASNVRYARVGEGDPHPPILTIMETVEYKVLIEEWKNGVWVPYAADDVPIEWVMLDPYVRSFLKHDGQGTFSTQFQLPDVYGIFKFRLEYARAGYTSLEHEESVPVRPFAHTQYERFIVTAYPYYTASISMMIGFLLFVIVFLYHKW